MSDWVKTQDGWSQTGGNVDRSEINEIKSSLAQLEKNDMDSGTDISTYLQANPYVAPSDGYVFINTNGVTNTIFIANIQSATNTNKTTISCYTTTGYYDRASLFVKKGMKIFVNDSRCYARFFSFI